jgi:hypothetical protein
LQREGWHNRLDEGSLQRHIAEHKQRMEDLRLQMGVMHTKRAEIVDRALEKLQLVLERSQSDTLARILEVREKQDIEPFWRHCAAMGLLPDPQLAPVLKHLLTSDRQIVNDTCAKAEAHIINVLQFLSELTARDLRTKLEAGETLVEDALAEIQDQVKARIHPLLETEEAQLPDAIRVGATLPRFECQEAKLDNLLSIGGFVRQHQHEVTQSRVSEYRPWYYAWLIRVRTKERVCSVHERRVCSERERRFCSV